MDRRDFLRISAAGLAGLSIPGFRLQASEGPEKDRYSIVILGDTHYDNPDVSVYHSGYTDPKPEREEAHRKEFVRNGKMWTGRCRDLVKRAACLVDDDTRYVFQVGDLIQGDTADAEVHKRFLDDAVTMLKGAIAAELPFVTVTGNHDVRGKDDSVARKAYVEYMTDRMSKELGQDISDVNFMFRSGPDAFVVIDFNKPKVDRIKALLEEARGSRHIFVMVHAPAFPFDSPNYWYWYLLGNKKDSRAEQRREIRALMASLNVIVLCGHSHTTEFLDWRGDGGRITQMTMSSVWSSEARGHYKVDASGAKEYGNAKGKAIFDEYRPGVVKYSKSDAAGSYKLVVDGSRVYVDFYAGDSARRSKRFILR